VENFKPRKNTQKEEKNFKPHSTHTGTPNFPKQLRFIGESKDFSIQYTQNPAKYQPND
jgi:hypothetical protein